MAANAIIAIKWEYLDYALIFKNLGCSEDNRFKIFGCNCRNITGKGYRILFNASMEKLLPDLMILNEARNYDR